MSKKEKKEKKKRRHTGLIIVLSILGFFVLAIGGLVLTVYLKLANMSKSAPPIVTAPAEFTEIDVNSIEQPTMNLIPQEDYNKIDLTEDYDIEISKEEMTDDPIYEVPHHYAYDGKVINILLLGNDARDQYDHGRSDTMLLLSYNRSNRSAKLVSFLRDTWIYIPGRAKWNRINTAYRFGGVGLAINTINYNFGLDIQHYMRVDFNNLRYIVDALGGIDVELTEREVDYINSHCNSKLTPGAGMHHLNGEQALRHARNRRIGGDGDWSRTRRQRDIMYAMLNKIKQKPDVGSLISLVWTLMDHVDTNLTPQECIDLAVDFVFGGDVALANRALPFEGTWQYAWEGRMAVIHIDIAANRQKLHQYLYGG